PAPPVARAADPYRARGAPARRSRRGGGEARVFASCVTRRVRRFRNVAARGCWARARARAGAGESGAPALSVYVIRSAGAVRIRGQAGSGPAPPPIHSLALALAPAPALGGLGGAEEKGHSLREIHRQTAPDLVQHAGCDLRVAPLAGPRFDAGGDDAAHEAGHALEPL